MNQEIYTDGISAIHVTGQLVRIDLMSVQPHLKSDNGQPVIEVNKRIIIPLEGFAQSLSVQENIIKQLIAGGVLKQNPAASDGADLPEKSEGSHPGT